MDDNIEILVKKIHNNYNAVQLERYPDRELDYPTWEDLPQTLKFSNIRNAKDMLNKLSKIDMCVSSEVRDNEVKVLTVDEVEYLAKLEHDSWIEERKSNGWKYGEEKNVDLKISPYMVTYDKLTEEIKEYDRDTVRNIIQLLNSIGLKVYMVK